MDSKISSQSSPLEPSQVSFAEATADTLFSNYSHSASGFLTQSQTDTLVNGGVATAIANAQATFNNDAALSTLFSDSTGSIVGNNSQVKSSSETKVTASFSLAAQETLSFDFSADLALTVNKTKNSKSSKKEAKSETAFLILDTSDINQPKLLDYFDLSGDLGLRSRQEFYKLNISARSHITIDDQNIQSNIDGSNHTQSLTGEVSGTYQERFNTPTNITIVEINDSSVQLSENTLIGNQNHQDLLTGGDSNKVLVGESDHGTFTVKKDDLRPGEYDITNFDAGKDEVELQGWGSNIDASTWFNGIVSGHQLVDTDKGALLNLDSGEYLLFKGVHTDQLSPSNFHFL